LTKGLIVEQPKPDRPSPQTGPAILTRRYFPQSSAEKGNRIQVARWTDQAATLRHRANSEVLLRNNGIGNGIGAVSQWWR
jgi:hypothetical protein